MSIHSDLQSKKPQSRQQTLNTQDKQPSIVKQQKQVERPKTQMAISRHNEYNNNEEDYSKSSKGDLIQNIFNFSKRILISTNFLGNGNGVKLL